MAQQSAAWFHPAAPHTLVFRQYQRTMSSNPSSEFTVDGGCLCGRIRYRATLSKDIGGAYTPICHCSLCRRATGALLASYFWFPRENLAFLSPEENKPKHYESSPGTQRGFCPECGTQLFMFSGHDEAHCGVTLGSLDDPNRLKPGQHIFWNHGIESMKELLILDKQMPKYAEFSNEPPLDL
ncbi:uncharacterized protein VTP21DRAFT_11725 [Calcarisporiella thermophila]|uniref:uncharacterized protein n=1 Tax=Calcarisporiella thermophila TaxID=911321 RepID=UPI003742105A